MTVFSRPKEMYLNVFFSGTNPLFLNAFFFQKGFSSYAKLFAWITADVSKLTTSRPSRIAEVKFVAVPHLKDGRRMLSSYKKILSNLTVNVKIPKIQNI